LILSYLGVISDYRGIVTVIAITCFGFGSTVFALQLLNKLGVFLAPYNSSNNSIFADVSDLFTRAGLAPGCGQYASHIIYWGCVVAWAAILDIAVLTALGLHVDAATRLSIRTANPACCVVASAIITL
jgi:hypothetical protein